MFVEIRTKYFSLEAAGGRQSMHIYKDVQGPTGTGRDRFVWKLFDYCASPDLMQEVRASSLSPRWEDNEEQNRFLRGPVLFIYQTRIFALVAKNNCNLDFLLVLFT
jgi:hypothetical protein